MYAFDVARLIAQAQSEGSRDVCQIYCETVFELQTGFEEHNYFLSEVFALFGEGVAAYSGHQIFDDEIGLLFSEVGSCFDDEFQQI